MGKKNGNIISVILATYNRCEYLPDVLHSLLDQMIDGNFSYEMIVIDNNSNDKTKEIVEDFIKISNGKIRYAFESRQGKHFALNSGIEVAKGNILAFTDDDVVITRNWLSTINKLFQKTTSIEMASGKIIPLWSNNKPEWYSEKMRSVIPHIDLGDLMKPTEFATGANMVMRREVWVNFGPFEDSQAIEDSLFSKKVSKKIIIWYIPKLVVYHKILEDRLTKYYFRRWYIRVGKSMAIIRSQYETWERTYFHIPVWFYKRIFINAWQYAVHIFNDKERFYYECRIRRQISFCLEIWFGSARKVQR